MQARVSHAKFLQNKLLFLAEREYCWAPVESTLGIPI
jgi:hypothetical protein